MSSTNRRFEAVVHPRMPKITREHKPANYAVFSVIHDFGITRFSPNIVIVWAAVYEVITHSELSESPLEDVLMRLAENLPIGIDELRSRATQGLRKMWNNCNEDYIIEKYYFYEQDRKVPRVDSGVDEFFRFVCKTAYMRRHGVGWRKGYM